MHNRLKHLIDDIKSAGNTAERVEHLLIIDHLFVDETGTVFKKCTVFDSLIIIETDQIDEGIHLSQISLGCTVLFFEKCEKNDLLFGFEFLLFEKTIEYDIERSLGNPLINPLFEKIEFVLDTVDPQRVFIAVVTDNRHLLIKFDTKKLVLKIFQMIGVGFNVGESHLQRPLFEELHKDRRKCHRRVIQFQMRKFTDFKRGKRVRSEER